MYIYLYILFFPSLILSIIIFGNWCIQSFNEFVRFSLHICFSFCLDFISIFDRIQLFYNSVFVSSWMFYFMHLRFAFFFLYTCVLFFASEIHWLFIHSYSNLLLHLLLILFSFYLSFCFSLFSMLLFWYSLFAVCVCDFPLFNENLIL